MYLGRVTGCVWATAKDPGLNARKLLIIQPVTPDLRDTGKRVVCADCTGAGAGEIVYWLRGKEASFPFLPTEVPVDAANGLSRPSVVSCDNLTTIPVEALGEQIGVLLDHQEPALSEAIGAAFDLD